MTVKYDKISMRFGQNSFFNSILDFSSHWYYGRNDEYISEKIINLITVDKVHLKIDVFDSSVVNCVLQPLKKTKWVLNTITFYVEDDNHRGVDFNGETLTFVSHFINIWKTKGAVKKIKSSSYCVGGRLQSATMNIHGGITSKSWKKQLLVVVRYVIEKIYDCLW